MDTTSADLAALMLRVAVGLMMVVHAYNKVFGTGGIAGTARWFDHLGMRPGYLHAWMAALGEFCSGTLLALGFVTPAACGGLVALMFVAARTDHRGKGFFVFQGGWEYVAIVAIVCSAIASIGPGSISLDAVAGIDTSGAWYGVGAGVIGVIAGQLFLTAFQRPNVPVALERHSESAENG